MEELLENLGIKPRDINLYLKALTHSSYANENGVESNERLEFLGDAVLELLMSKYLFEKTDLSEGKMTVKRAQAVREEALLIYSNKINLKDYIRLGHGEQLKGASNALIADAFEALFAAVYLDLGLNQSQRLFNKIIIPNLEESFTIKDYKSTLQELAHSDVRNISYQIIKESGPSHNKNFEAIVLLDREIVLGTGYGKTKKEAEQEAAKDALKRGNYDITKTLWKLWF